MRGGASVGPWDSSLGHGPSTPSLHVGQQGPATRSPGFGVFQRMPRVQGVPAVPRVGRCWGGTRPCGLLPGHSISSCNWAVQAALGPTWHPLLLQVGKPRKRAFVPTLVTPLVLLLSGKQPSRKPLGRQANLGRGCVLSSPFHKGRISCLKEGLISALALSSPPVSLGRVPVPSPVIWPEPL